MAVLPAMRIRSLARGSLVGGGRAAQIFATFWTLAMRFGGVLHPGATVELGGGSGENQAQPAPSRSSST